MERFTPTIEVKRPKPPIESVTVKMDSDTAHALAAVLARVSGNELSTRRGRVQAILDGLTDAGIGYNTDDLEGSLAFYKP